MKKTLAFILGIVAGIVLTIITLITINRCTSPADEIIFFDTEGECVSHTNLRVFQVLDNGDALATLMDYGVVDDSLFDTVVLILAEDGYSYYDNQIIKIPYGKCAKQIGVFKYTTTNNTEKTVPVVDILEI